MSRILVLIFIVLINCSASYSQYINDTLGVRIILDSTAVPDSTELKQNYPNPFCVGSKYYIKFNLHEKSLIILNFYNKDRILLAVFFEKELEPGYYSIDWGANKFPTGLYYYELVTNNYKKSLKFVLIK